MAVVIGLLPCMIWLCISFHRIADAMEGKTKPAAKAEAKAAS